MAQWLVGEKSTCRESRDVPSKAHQYLHNGGATYGVLRAKDEKIAVVRSVNSLISAIFENDFRT